MKFKVTSTDANTPLFASTKRQALALGYRIAREGLIGARTTVWESDVPIAAWTREAGKRPTRLSV